MSDYYLKVPCRLVSTQSTYRHFPKRGQVSDLLSLDETLLHRDDLIARASKDAIEIWPCLPIPDDDFRFLPQNGTCTREIQVSFVMDTVKHHGFLDTKTNIVYKAGFPTDCDLNHEMPVTHKYKTYLYQSKTGELASTSHLTELAMMQFNFSAFAPLPSTVFRQVMMYNWTEVQGQISLNDLLGSVQSQRQIFAELGVRDNVSPARGAKQLLSKMSSRAFFGFLSGLDVDLWQIWVFCCCFGFTLYFLIKMCCPQLLDHIQLNPAGAAVHLVQQWMGLPPPPPPPGMQIEMEEAFVHGPPVPGAPPHGLVVHGDPPPQYKATVVYQAGNANPTVMLAPPNPRSVLVRKPTDSPQLPRAPMLQIAMVHSPAASLPSVTLELCGIRVSAIVDMGSPVSILNQDFLQTLGMTVGLPHSADRILAVDITWQSVELTALGPVEVTYSGKAFPLDVFAMAKSPAPCVLGMDFCRKAQQLSLTYPGPPAGEAGQPLAVYMLATGDLHGSSPPGAKPRAAPAVPLLVPMVMVGLGNGKLRPSVIDTGAAVSILLMSIAEQLTDQQNWKQPAQGLSISNKPLPFDAATICTITLGESSFKQEFQIMEDSPYEVILGSDFLAKLDPIILDFSRKRFCFGSQSMELNMRPAAMVTSALDVLASMELPIISLLLRPATLVNDMYRALAKLAITAPITVGFLPGLRELAACLAVAEILQLDHTDRLNMEGNQVTSIYIHLLFTQILPCRTDAVQHVLRIMKECGWETLSLMGAQYMTRGHTPHPSEVKVDPQTDAIPLGIPLQFGILQRQDEKLLNVIQALEMGHEQTARSSQFQMVGKLLYRNHQPTSRKSLQFPLRLVIPASYQMDIMDLHHSDVFSGHLGFDKTFSRINQRFFWDSMRWDIAAYCDQCQLCQTRKHPHQYIVDPLTPLPVSGPFDRVAVDVVGPMHMSEQGNRYIMVFSDYLTKYVEAFALPEISAATTAKYFVEGVVCRHGAPVELLSDCAQNFLATLVLEICQLLNTRKRNTTPYHPACNGLVERFNKTLGHMLSMFSNRMQADWDQFLPFVLFAYHTTKHSTTQETLAFLMFGRDLRLPSDVAFRCDAVTYTIYDENYSSFIRVALTEARLVAQEAIKKKQAVQKNNTIST